MRCASEPAEGAASAVCSNSLPPVHHTIYENTERVCPLEGLCGELCRSLDYICKVENSLTRLDSTVPNVIFFKIENRNFAVHKCTLEKDPQSLLFVLANEHFTSQHPQSDEVEPAKKRGKQESNPIPSSHEGINYLNFPSSRHFYPSDSIIILNRNPDIFEKLLNFLRGYKSAIPPEWEEQCKAEAYFYGLQRSWNKSFPPSPKENTSWTFVESSKKDIIHCDTLWTIIGETMERGLHQIDFSCYGDKAGFGLICRTNNDFFTDGLFYSRPNIFYCTDEKIRKISESAAIHRIPDAKRSAENAIEIRISFDADNSVVRWDRLNGNEWCSAAMHRLKNGVTYGFCVISAPGAKISFKY